MLSGKDENMNTIFFNGVIYTQDPAYPRCSAAAIRNGIITALGSDEEVLSLRETGTELIDLKGSFMVPGFVDSHLHFLFYAQEKSCVDLSQTSDFEEAARLCRQQIPSAEESGKWIYAVGFNQDNWKEKRLPTRADLDEISDKVPVVMRRACHHIMIGNSRALELAGLEAEAPDGMIRELQQNKVADAMPLPCDEELKQLISLAAKDAAAKGITQVHTDDFAVFPGDPGERIIKIYREMAEADRLDVRIYEQCNLPSMEQLKAFLAQGHRTGQGCGFFKTGPLKLLTDGSLGAHTAAMIQPYRNDPKVRGILNYEDEELFELVREAHDNDMQIAIHCIGDDALRQAVTAVSRAHFANPKKDMRHGIIHCQIMSRQQQDWFRKLNLLAYIQPVFLRSDMYIADGCVGEELAESSYNWRRFADLGVHQSGGSDCPVEPFDILPNLEYAVTRRNPDTGKVWYKENGLTLAEALRVFTYEGAYASFDEQVRGSVTVGKEADLTVIDRNLFEIPAEEIHNAKVILTMTGGRITFREGMI